MTPGGKSAQLRYFIESEITHDKFVPIRPHVFNDAMREEWFHGTWDGLTKEVIKEYGSVESFKAAVYLLTE